MSLFSRLYWYKNRLTAMSGGEILHRIHEAARKKRDAFTSERLICTPRDRGELPRIPRLREGLDQWRVPDSLILQWQEEARAAQAGEHIIFGLKTLPGPRGAMWHADPHSGAPWPRDAFTFSIDYRHGREHGDIKYVWELNRLQYLQVIAALAFKRKDKALAAFCLNEIDNWIDNNPPFHGINWNSGIELALRVISILVVTSLVGEFASQGQRAKIWASLETHGRWIARYPSLYSSSNNHRTAEALGLFALGALCPSLSEALAWKKEGFKALSRAAQQQILSDGAGAEQAIGYAASVLETLLLGLVIAEGTDFKVPDYYRHKIIQGGEYLRWLTDEGGNQPHIGDDDNSCVIGSYHEGDHYVSSVLGIIAGMAQRADLSPPNLQPHLRQVLFDAVPKIDFKPYGVRKFGAGGITIGRHASAGGDILLAFDHGPLGYLSIAAHGHADTLSLWLHIGGQPVFVDAGTYIYHSADHARDLFRSTAQHNTMCVEGQNSSTISGNFNWSHKAGAFLQSLNVYAGKWRIEAEHDGYAKKLACVHHRAVEVDIAKGAVIEDTLISPAPRQVEISYLLHPALTARQEGHEIHILKGELLLLRLTHDSPLEAHIGFAGGPYGGWYSPSFGVRQPTTKLVFRGVLPADQKAITKLFWLT